MPADKQKVAGSPAGIQSNPSAAVAAAIQMEREQTHQHRQQQQQNLLARNLMIRRASMPGMGGAGMGMGMAPPAEDEEVDGFELNCSAGAVGMFVMLVMGAACGA